jgi:hypothetical protein
MLSRISVNAILKSVIVTLGAAVVLMLALGAWSSWSRLVAAKRIVAVADASSYMFAALDRLRNDRAVTLRDMQAETQFTAVSPVIRAAREAEMPALRSAAIALAAVDLPDREAVVTDFARRVDKVASPQQETAAALLRPKAERPPALAQGYVDETSTLLDKLEELSSRLTRSVKLEDAFIDQVMELKQLVWMARVAAGDERHDGEDQRDDRGDRGFDSRGRQREATQQNSALVEENAATAKTLEQQSQDMHERVSFFQLGDAAEAEAPSRVVAMVPKRSAAGSRH